MEKRPAFVSSMPVLEVTGHSSCLSLEQQTVTCIKARVCVCLLSLCMRIHEKYADAAHTVSARQYAIGIMRNSCSERFD